MKRYKYFDKEKQIILFAAICDMDNLKLAHKMASKGKHYYKEVKMVNENPEFYLGEIQEMLVNKTYKVSDYEIFERLENDKLRKIYKLPYYPDRIIQWAILLIIAPILEKRFIKNTYSSLKGRGQHKCLADVKKALRDSNNKFCLKIDIKKFYPSINHGILKSQYARIFKDKDLLNLINLTIDSVPENEGVPIGNFLSQYSGNLYLTDFDHWIHNQKIPYFRYMDDMVFLGKSKAQLSILLDKIKREMNKLKLTLKSNYQIFPIKIRGIDFVGYRIFPDFILVRKKTVKKFKKLVLKLKQKQIMYSDWCAYQSYRGIICHADSYRLLNKYKLEVDINES